MPWGLLSHASEIQSTLGPQSATEGKSKVEGVAYRLRINISKLMES